MTDQARPGDVIEIPEEEERLAFTVPAPFANKFYVNLTNVTGRIAFAELPPKGPPIVRNAIAMTLPDLLSLANVIQQLAKRHMQATRARPPTEQQAPRSADQDA